jgi:hypothetical protein
MANPDWLLNRLDEATQTLERADLEDADALEACLQRRLEALRDIHSLSTQSPEFAARLRQSLDGGRRVEKRLRLRRAALQAQLAENHTTAILLRSLSAPALRPDFAFETRAYA